MFRICSKLRIKWENNQTSKVNMCSKDISICMIYVLHESIKLFLHVLYIINDSLLKNQIRILIKLT